MAQYATLSPKTPGAKDETQLSDNLFRVAQDQSHIRGDKSGNNSSNNHYGNIFNIVSHGGADSGVRSQGGVPGAREAGIIRTPERYLAKN